MREQKNVPAARRLRQRETDLERRLWRELRACLEARLLIEIDGYWHQFKKAEDAARGRALKATGFDIVRYDIENESADVSALAEAIAHEARIRIDL